MSLCVWPTDATVRTLRAAPAPARYVIGLDNGQRLPAQRITAWEPDLRSLKLDDRQWMGSDPALRWIYDRQSELASGLEAWLETWTGDRLPGDVLSYSDGRADAAPLPPHLVMRSVTPERPPRQGEYAQVRVRSVCVRRIVWHDEGRPYQPSTVWTRDGRRIDFRALRWSSDSVTLLANDGRHTFRFRELSELNLPQQSFWPPLMDELAFLTPAGVGELVQFETSQGVVVTTSWQCQRVARPLDRTKASNWLQGVQPAWSLDVLWLPGNEIPLRRFFQPHEIPLSRLMPSKVVQHSPIAGQGRPWQRDRNVEGGKLESGPGPFGWGFGVHAHNELHFQLPPTATAVSGFVGLDALAGKGGCVQARLLLNSPETQILFQTPVIVGAQQVYATGVREFKNPSPQRTLVLQVDAAHAQRPEGADPLDIRDSADWLDPLLFLDPVALEPLIARQTATHVYACRDWQWRVSPETHLQFRHVWDELSQADSRYALGVVVGGTAPLRLVRQQQLREAVSQLVVTVSCPLRTNPPVRIEVFANGKSLSSLDVPVLDRGHLDLAPQVVALDTIHRAGDVPVAFEIHQFSGSPDAPVQWHAIEFR